MHCLRALNIPAVLDTSTHDFGADFFDQALSCSVQYDRGVGYFSSGWLKVACGGMVRFAANGGRARWITSPILHPEDWEALRLGDRAKIDDVLRERLRAAIVDLRTTLDQDVRSALAWMVADGIITFRLAVPRAKLSGGEFHDKFGIFYDLNNDALSFNGSYNDSVQGVRNYESIKVFRSWEPVLAPLVSADSDRFERLWENCDPNIEIYDLPDAVRADILKLRSGTRPYPTTSDDGVSSGDRFSPARPMVPNDLSLRDYQETAIEAWFANECRGLLEMATGTGKTITALATSVRLAQREGRLATIIVAPYQHLVDQWAAEAERFGHRPVLAYRDRKKWIGELNEQAIAFTAGFRSFVSVITTHATFASDEFQAAIARLSGPVLLVADEAHHMGASRIRRTLPEDIPFRLGMSATPDRWFDDDGTEVLRKYFGTTVFALPLADAIGISLTPYYYFPHLVELTEEEFHRYRELTTRIARALGSTKGSESDAFQRLLIRRADLLNMASGKLATLSNLVDDEEDLSHALFYCAPGQMEDTIRLLGWRKGLLVHRFTAHETPRERQRLLADFAAGSLQALVAMKCLDEGVDVPNTRLAYLLASSGNPREFTQRRGRLLRRAPGKTHAVIHDLIAVPPASEVPPADSSLFAIERSVVRREMDRFHEFAGAALNKHGALDAVWEIASRYGLTASGGGAHADR